MTGSMRVLFVTAEVYPLAKSGGLADVSAALPVALKDHGFDVRVLMPAYRQALERISSAREIIRLGDPLGYGETRLLETYLPISKLPVWLVDCPTLYNRGGGLYQDENNCDWPDNDRRFALLNRVAAGIANAPRGRWRPDIVHANDWHAGLGPLLVRAQKRNRPATVFTIHNLAYQGVFGSERVEQLGLAADSFAEMEFHGKLSFMKAGISSADAITTVSPTYAKEILTPEYGCGLDGLLRERVSRLSGILNGVDYNIWDPSVDPHLARNYTARSVASKGVNKRATQTELGLDIAPEKPLLAFMSRLVHQKMPDIVLEALPQLIEDGMQFALVAEGDNEYEERFRQLAVNYPGSVAVQIGYEEQLAHRLLAGADILLHPSRFEPCGLVPIYAMRYGTIPVARRSGGMADSVTDATLDAIQEGTANGFLFEPPTTSELIESARRAHELYRQPIAWRKMQVCAMRQDFGWHRAAEVYADLYRSLVRLPQMVDDVEPSSVPVMRSA
jgi:starch synthase